MKKLIFASLLLASALTACAGKNNENKHKPIEQTKNVQKSNTKHP